MPTGCCGHASCSCQIVTGGRLSVEGSGQPGDPFVIDLEADFDSGSNATFDTIASGIGSAADPWVIETQYALTAKLDHLPDVNVPAPTNAQVLSWDAPTSKWVAAAPTTAPVGAVLHDTSLTGDGSAGSPMAVVPSTSRLLGSFPSGVGLSDLGLASVVQHYADAAARTAALPSPTINMLTMLDSSPGVVWYWTGSKWSLLPNQTTWVATGGSFLELSGPYQDGAPVTVLVKQLSITTDASGLFSVLDAADLLGKSGVLSPSVQETGAIAWKAMLHAAGSTVTATAYRMTDGSVMAATPLTGTVQAILY